VKPNTAQLVSTGLAAAATGRGHHTDGARVRQWQRSQHWPTYNPSTAATAPCAPTAHSTAAGNTSEHGVDGREKKPHRWRCSWWRDGYSGRRPPATNGIVHGWCGRAHDIETMEGNTWGLASHRRWRHGGNGGLRCHGDGGSTDRFPGQTARWVRGGARCSNQSNQAHPYWQRLGGDLVA
jgi:hypothetical protein